MSIDFISHHLPEILVIAFAIIALLQILYYVALFFRFSLHKQTPVGAQNVPVSIVLTAKNDAHLLIKTLPILLTQDYPQFEVVVVNDNSNDETPQLITDFQNRFPNLKLVHLESSVTNIRGKKFPLSLGIRAATYEHVLLTDADCLPASNQWVKLIARHFNDTTKIVLGYSNIGRKAGFINTLIRFDKLHQAIQYFSYCLAKNPFMGVGQNLAYSKTLFFDSQGFAHQNHLQFGDDDLFVNRIANSCNCAIEYEKESHTTSRIGSNFSHWFLLKTFRSKTHKLYGMPKRFYLSFYNFLMTFSYVMLGFAIYVSLNSLLYLLILSSIFVIKLAIQYVCFGFAAAKLNEKRLVPHTLFFDIIFSILNPVVYVASKLKKL